jgi:hypothetical protein
MNRQTGYLNSIKHDFFLNINEALDLFENVIVLGYADDLKLFMTIKCIGGCQLSKGSRQFG